MRAHANFGWATVGRDDFIEMRALVYSAVSAWLGDRRGLGKREWKRALEMGGPVALDIRMQLAEELSAMGSMTQFRATKPRIQKKSTP